MGLSKHWATDKKKEAGIVISFGDNGFGKNMLFNISRMNRTNKTYSKKLAEVFESHKRELQLEILPEEIAEDLMLDVFVSSIINSMQNIPLSDVTGNEKDKGIADDTIENRKAVMKNLPDLYDELQARAKSIVSFRGSNAKN